MGGNDSKDADMGECAELPTKTSGRAPIQDASTLRDGSSRSPKEQNAKAYAHLLEEDLVKMATVTISTTEKLEVPVQAENTEGKTTANNTMPARAGTVRN